MSNKRRIGNKMVSIDDVYQIDIELKEDGINKVMTIYHENCENESFNIGYNQEIKKEAISFIHELASLNKINTGINRLPPMEDKVNSLKGKYGFIAGVEYATKWNKINIADVETFPEEHEPVLVKDGDWLFVGVRYGSAFFTDGDSIEIINNFEWRLINFK